MSQTVAFFDLDRTLIDINSGLLWAQHELKAGNISKRQFSTALLWTMAYHLSVIDMETAIDSAVAHYRGVARSRIDERTRRWFFSDVEGHLRPKARDALEAHRARGHRLVLLTSSSCFEARAATEAFGLDEYLSNEFPSDDEGRLLGHAERPLCYGAGKVARAEAWAEDRDVDLDRSYFYSDSYSDAPMLARVGQPRVVAPDLRLRWLSLRRGWPILDW